MYPSAAGPPRVPQNGGAVRNPPSFVVPLARRPRWDSHPGGLDSWRGPHARILRGDKNKGRRTSPAPFGFLSQACRVVGLHGDDARKALLLLPFVLAAAANDAGDTSQYLCAERRLSSPSCASSCAVPSRSSSHRARSSTHAARSSPASTSRASFAACIAGNEHLKQLKCAACDRAIRPVIPTCSPFWT